MTIPKPADREGSGRVRFGGSVLRAVELEPGARVAGGAYEILGVLGRGGMATVYSALRRADGREVAFKVLNAKAAARADVEHRLHNERMLAAEVGVHPSIVAALDGGRLDEHGGAPFLVTARVHGPQLSYVIATERRLDPIRACRLALDIAEGLDALHAHGIAHRDVKPDNILVVTESERDGAFVGRGVDERANGDERAKLIDFGLATRIVAVGDEQGRVTLAGERPGTPMYMSPEQSMGAGATAAFDVYGLGVTLHEMLAGVTPFTGVTEAELLEYKLHRVAAMDLLAARGDLPAALPSLVQGCLAPLPSDRLGLAALQLGLRAVLGLRRAHPERAVDVTELSARAGAIEVEVAARGAAAQVLTAANADTPAVPSRAELLLQIHAPDPEPRGQSVRDGGGARAQADALAKREVVVRARSPGRWRAGAALALAVAALGIWLGLRPAPTRDQGESPVPPVADAAVAPDAPAVVDATAVEHGPPREAAPVHVLPLPVLEPKAPAPVGEHSAPDEETRPRNDSSTPPKAIPPKANPKAKPLDVSPKPAAPPKPAPGEREDPASTPACEAAHAKADAALKSYEWSAVLQATREASCWTHPTERIRMRARAFANLDRLEECIDAAGNSSDAVVRRQADACQKQIDKQREQP